MDSATTKQIHKPTSARRIVKKTVDIFFTVLLLLAIIVAVYIFQNKRTNGQVQIGEYQLYIVLSGSMSPTFDTGSVVLIRRIAPEDIAVGDIITFIGATDTGKTITHRVIAIDTKNGLQFTTRGDANNVADSVKQDPENIIGKVQPVPFTGGRYSIPYIGYFLEFSKTKTGIYLLIVLPSLLIFMLEIRKVIGYLLEKKRAKKTLVTNMQEPEKASDHRIEFLNQQLQKNMPHMKQSHVPLSEPNRAFTPESKTIPIVEQKRIPQISEDLKHVVPIPEDPKNVIPMPEEPKIVIPVPIKQTKAIVNTDKQNQISPFENAPLDLLSEVQNHSTQEIYHYRIQAEKTKKELHDKLESKLQEEEDLDRAIQQITEELLRKLNI